MSGIKIVELSSLISLGKQEISSSGFAALKLSEHSLVMNMLLFSS